MNKIDSVKKAMVAGLMVEDHKEVAKEEAYRSHGNGFTAEQEDDEDVPAFLKRKVKAPVKETKKESFAPAVTPFKPRGMFEIARNLERLQGVARDNLDDRERVAHVAFLLWCDVLDGTGLVMTTEDREALKKITGTAIRNAVKL